MDKHEMALQHAMKALVLIQDELVTRTFKKSGAEGDDKSPPPKSDDRFIILCIAYHNIAVEQEFMKQFQMSVTSYKKSYECANKYLGAPHPMTGNMKDVYQNALQVMADKIEKQISRKTKGKD